MSRHNDPFFAYFLRERQNLSQDLYGMPTAPVKEYPHASVVALPEPQALTANISELIARRHSTRDYTTEPIALENLATLLYWSCGMVEHEGKRVRPHASGGARYPLEPYLLAQRVAGVPAGAYHYNIQRHQLELIRELSASAVSDLQRKMFNYPFVSAAPATVCLTFIKSRSIQRYGALGYKLALIEAGTVCQNAYLIAGALALGCCGLGGGDADEFYETFGIDGGNEHLIFGMSLGMAADAR